MENKEILEKLQEIIREVVDDEDVQITAATTASDVDGWDSLANVMIVGQLQNEFGVKFTSTEVNKIANVGEFVHAIKSKMQQ